MDKYGGTHVQSIFAAEGVVFQKLLLVCWRNEGMRQWASVVGPIMRSGASTRSLLPDVA